MTTVITKHLIKLPTVGKGVLAWQAIEGQQVDQGQVVAHFTVGSVSHPVVAPCSGRLYRVTPTSTEMVGGNPVGRVHQGEQGQTLSPPASPSNVSNASPVPVSLHRNISSNPLRKPIPSSPPNPVGISGSQPVEHEHGGLETETPTPSSGVRRNSHLAELVIQELTPQMTKPKSKPKKRRMVNRTYSIAPDDEDEITRLVAALSRLKGVPRDINESLLVRVAISQLVESAKSIEGVSALIEAIEGRIKVEQKAGVGAGRRRPKKPRVL